MKDYGGLPDFMESDEIEECVSEILELAANGSFSSATKIAEALLEMTIRQSNNYKQFNSQLLGKIESWIVKEWNTSDFELFDLFCSLIVNLNSYVGFQLLENARASNDNIIQGLSELALSEMKHGEAQ